MVCQAGLREAYLMEDIELKAGLAARLKSADVKKSQSRLTGQATSCGLRSVRPVPVSSSAAKALEIEKLEQDLAKKTKREVFIDIQEVHKPELDAQLVAESIALQLEKRVAFRRAMRKAVDMRTPFRMQRNQGSGYRAG